MFLFARLEAPALKAFGQMKQPLGLSPLADSVAVRKHWGCARSPLEYTSPIQRTSLGSKSATCKRQCSSRDWLRTVGLERLNSSS